MAGAEVETLPTGYAEVTAAFQILRGVRKANLKWQPAIFNTVLYEGTHLARPEYVGENQVLMKNVYYLASKTQNMSDGLVVSLVDAAVLTVEEGNQILQQPTSKLRAVKMYALLVEKEDPDGSITKSVVSVLQAHENNEVTNIFADRFNIVPNNRDERDNVRQGFDDGVEVDNDVPERLEGDNQEELGNGQWACKFCTFINLAASNICDMCSKTIDFDLDESLEVNICPQCTLMNDDGALACDACGFVFEHRQPREEMVIRDLDDSDDANDD